MSEFTKLNGYEVCDEKAREDIEDLKERTSKVESGNFSPVGMYKGKNLVVFGDSFTDPVNDNSLNGYWVNRVAEITGMNAFNYAKGAASLMRTNNSYRMQVNRAISEMTQDEKDNTCVIIMYLADTDILENTTLDATVTEYETLVILLTEQFKNAKIIVAPFTWRCNKLLREYNTKMDDYTYHMKRWSKAPVQFLDNARYWLLGKLDYYQNEYHPSQNGYMVIANHFINAIYGGQDMIRETFKTYLNLDYQTDDRNCIVYHNDGLVTVEFHCVFSQDLVNKADWIANFTRIAIPEQDILAPLMTSDGNVVGTFRLNSANNGRADLFIKNLPAGTPVFLTPLTFRAVANVEYSN